MMKIKYHSHYGDDYIVEVRDENVMIKFWKDDDEYVEVSYYKEETYMCFHMPKELILAAAKEMENE